MQFDVLPRKEVINQLSPCFHFLLYHQQTTTLYFYLLTFQIYKCYSATNISTDHLFISKSSQNQPIQIWIFQPLQS